MAQGGGFPALLDTPELVVTAGAVAAAATRVMTGLRQPSVTCYSGEMNIEHTAKLPASCWWWLSFVHQVPGGFPLSGVSIVRGVSLAHACDHALTLGCYPGGASLPID